MNYRVVVFLPWKLEEKKDRDDGIIHLENYDIKKYTRFKLVWRIFTKKYHRLPLLEAEKI